MQNNHVIISRILKPVIAKSKKSVLLLGPRQVGKSTLIDSLAPELKINLADEAQYLDLQAEPGLLRQQIEARNPRTVFVDEIQRIPALTNSIQALIDANRTLKFYISGSSARKLRRGSANLLPGRVLSYRLGPICAAELDYKLNDEMHLAYGFLPEIVSNSDSSFKRKLLGSYATTYLKEEIQAEALVRELSGFVRFLKVAAATSGQFLDYSKMAKRAKIPRQSAVRHFEILEDTLIAYKLDPEELSHKADLIKHPRFFFFDVGVLNALLGNFNISSDRIGLLFEHMFISQLYASAFARDVELDVRNFRTRGGLEVDLVINNANRKYAVELKAATHTIPSDLQGLIQISRYYGSKITRFLAYRGTKELKQQNIWVLPWVKVLRELGL